ncbi:hypothetical protein OA93_06875 [Flavobacterium sp. KMS]|uniref:hypothetical protein n=1 Tax=Flavobacterium sp. KMS TaxID=1566023 RepID=UPI00057D60F7|nr:hypothetical protein [Flavobacterium sp. KMS]KIA98940.1 hypothetical protein OA93_06875 [Flavobacterium sp. KMS]
MKKYISLFILILFSISGLKAQERKKDTLFFNIDKYYTISPTITPNLSKQIYAERIEFEKEQMKHTKTNGYIFFVGDGFLTKDLKPKKILSIKKYIENRKFYFDGKHNEMVDKWKLKDSLTEKYIIYFVNGNEFIQPRYLEYYSYYPIGKGENAVNNKIKDTLYFKLDNSYVYRPKDESKTFLLKDGHDTTNGGIYFETIRILNGLKPKEIFSLEKFVRSSKFYDDNKKVKLNDYELYGYFNNYVLVLVEEAFGGKKYVEVEPMYAIE